MCTVKYAPLLLYSTHCNRLPDAGSPAVYDNLENQLVNCAVNPNDSYLQYPIRFLVEVMVRAAPVYMPVHALPLLLFGRSKLMREPVSTLLRLAR